MGLSNRTPTLRGLSSNVSTTSNFELWNKQQKKQTFHRSENKEEFFHSKKSCKERILPVAPYCGPRIFVVVMGFSFFLTFVVAAVAATPEAIATEGKGVVSFVVPVVDQVVEREYGDAPVPIYFTLSPTKEKIPQM
jgi:hypothetical protein